MNKIMQKFRKFLADGSRVGRDEEGQIIIFTALSGLVLVLMVASIFNVGVVIGEKMKAQDAADAGAYSQAVWEARTLNMLAYTNRAIISHMVTIAFCTAVFSQKELWHRIKSVLSLISAFPYIGYLSTGANALYSFWSTAANFAGTAREWARDWIIACQVAQDIMMAEFRLVTLRGDIPERAAGLIDPNIRANQSVNNLADTWNYGSLESLTGSSRKRMNFDSFEEVYRNSMDGFSNGTSFPRRAGLNVWPLFEVGFRGDLEINRGRYSSLSDTLVQKEEFFAGVVWNFRPWPFDGWIYEARVPVVREPYTDLKLDGFEMWSNHLPGEDGEDIFPSVYVIATKSRQDILQIPLLNIGTNQDVNAFARAEVFYWDPDEGRRGDLETMQPNLFNPFWHARLAPVDEELEGLLGNWVNYLPITH